MEIWTEGRGNGCLHFASLWSPSQSRVIIEDQFPAKEDLKRTFLPIAGEIGSCILPEWPVQIGIGAAPDN